MDQRNQTGGSTTSFHQVLIIIFGSLFFAGGGNDPLAERVQDAVPDNDRGAKAVAEAAAIDEARGQDVTAVIAWHEEFFKVIGQPDAGETVVRAKIDEVIDQLEALERHQLSLRSDLRGHLEPSEWSEIFD
ncbi:MAG: hypothetical protein P8M11_12300 [Planctomycetota bacterium]|nr:hypothetical protein [Planctomycetota bacterium]